jgi:hypothetical protein
MTRLSDNPTWQAKARLERAKPEPRRRPKPPKPAVLDVEGKPIPPHMAKDPVVRGFMQQKQVQPMHDAVEIARWQEVVQKRRDRQHAIDCSPGGIFAWENSFLEDERRRKVAARGQLRRGMPIDAVAIVTGLSISEVEALTRD